MSCIAVSAFHLACTEYRKFQEAENTPEANLITIPDPADVVTISQSRCSPADLLRMQDIMASKLELAGNPGAAAEPPVTTLTLLRLMYAISKSAADRIGLAQLMPSAGLPSQLVHQLEILVCDSLTLDNRPAEVALALLTTHLQTASREHPSYNTAIIGIVSELQRFCSTQSMQFVACVNMVMGQLQNYNTEGTVIHRQRLIWKLSNRTLRHLRPTDKLRPTLPTILENNGPNIRLR